MLKGSILDVAVIIVYFAAILGFGAAFGRVTKTTKDFFFGGQRFSWWLIAFSCVATVVGSYSFIKYSAVGYSSGFSATMTYLNDWFILPLFVLGWMPLIFFSGVTSIPEFFEKRFNRTARRAGVVIMLVYLVGYIGINLYTIGVAFESMLGWNIMTTAVLISVVCAIYMHAGGQTSVIMTDLAQSVILIAAGVLIFALGLVKIGGFEPFWHSLTPSFKLPFSGLYTPPSFSTAGIFWQDAMGSSLAFYFMTQGVIMRFLSVKSPREGRRALFVVVLVLMPLAAFAVANAGWIGKSMVALGLFDAEVQANNIFVEVANAIARPGLFGFIMAALTAALMSTVDTLINAVSAVTVNDIIKPLAPNRDDSYYLKWARRIALIAAAAGVLLVPLFASFKSIYTAHGSFTAAVSRLYWSSFCWVRSGSVLPRLRQWPP
jgi:SSS family solute:Na+ symporter